jgi:methylenetetrahydrofolate dehydrogenase (NADP+)/methenyltetrahydrofolate cyclohydrolase
VAADIIDGKAFAAGVRSRLAGHVRNFVERTGRQPGLAVVLVGDDPASHVYVRAKGRATIEAGMASFEHRLPADTDGAALMDMVAQLNADRGVDGILVQLPLPGSLDAEAVIAAIDPAKDVDGFHVVNAGRLALGLPGLAPCTPLGCLALLKDRLGSLAGLDAVVIGRSNIVGKPMAQLLLQQNCTVTIAHSRTRDLAATVRRADIVVAAVGQAEMVKGDWLKPGATLIDVDGRCHAIGVILDGEAVEIVAVEPSRYPNPDGHKITFRLPDGTEGSKVIGRYDQIQKDLS